MKPLRWKTVAIIVIAPLVYYSLLASAVFILQEFFPTTQQLIPRNVKVCFGRERTMRSNPIHNLFELNGSTLTVIRLPVSGGSWDEELGEHTRPIFDSEDYAFGMEYAELIATEVIDAFNESFPSTPRIYDHAANENFPFPPQPDDRHNIYVMRGKVELSQEQLEYVWLLIDCVVQNYEAPFRLDTNQHLAPPLIRVAIDGAVYQSRFSSYVPPRSRDFRIFQRNSGSIRGISDDSTLRLLHHLIKLSPIPTGWERWNADNPEVSRSLLNGS